MAKADRFQKAARLAEVIEADAPMRADLSPKSASEVRELEWTRSGARQAFGEECADRAMDRALFRLAGYPDLGPPTSFDKAILVEIDDYTLERCAGGSDRVRLLAFRNELRKTMPPTFSPGPPRREPSEWLKRSTT